MEPYNPLDKLNLARSVSNALLLAPVIPLTLETTAIHGSGVFAIYYTGNFPAYAPVAFQNKATNYHQPIYVGRANPKGGRKGRLGKGVAIGTSMKDRLHQHINSISDTSNLQLDDFFFRCLVVDELWIPLGESMMIEQFKPVWNLVIDGFGNKDPGKRRATQYRSPWDVLHPGRKFIEKLAPNPHSEKFFLDKLSAFFAGTLPASALIKVKEEE